MNLIYKNLDLFTSLYISTMDKFIENKAIFLARENIFSSIDKIRYLIEKEPFLLLNTLNIDGIFTLKDFFKSDMSDEYITWLKRNSFYFPEFEDSLKFWDDFLYLLRGNLEENQQFKPSLLLEQFIQNCWMEYDLNLEKNINLFRKEFMFFDVKYNSKDKTIYLYDSLSRYDKFIYDTIMKYDDDGFGFIYLKIEITITQQFLFHLFDSVNKIFSKQEIINLSDEFQIFMDNSIPRVNKNLKKNILPFKDIVILARK